MGGWALIQIVYVYEIKITRKMKPRKRMNENSSASVKRSEARHGMAWHGKAWRKHFALGDDDEFVD